ncbi:MAG: transcriptional regulator, MarR family [Bradyrhizobium sp.]|nr:transcriptional regulator, MarR family [Bradyrhizobium sp.]
MKRPSGLLPYRQSLAGTLLAAREAVMAPIRPALRSAEVTEQQWRVLRVLAKEGAIDPSKLSQDAILHAPSVTRILKDLVERGLVSRKTDTEDARRSIISITPLGEELVAKTAERTLEILDEFGQRFGMERLDALRGELIALASAIADLGAPQA